MRDKAAINVGIVGTGFIGPAHVEAMLSKLSSLSTRKDTLPAGPDPESGCAIVYWHMDPMPKREWGTPAHHPCFGRHFTF